MTTSPITTSTITVEHIQAKIKRPYQVVISALEKRLGSREKQQEAEELLASPDVPWEQILKHIQIHGGTSNFTTFLKVDLGLLNARAGGKNHRITTYAFGNPVLAQLMTSEEKRVAFHIPLRFVVYEEEEEATTVVEYDRFASLVARFHNKQLDSIAQIVDQKLDELVQQLITAHI